MRFRLREMVFQFKEKILAGNLNSSIRTKRVIEKRYMNRFGGDLFLRDTEISGKIIIYISCVRVHPETRVEAKIGILFPLSGIPGS